MAEVMLAFEPMTLGEQFELDLVVEDVDQRLAWRGHLAEAENHRRSDAK